MTKRPINFTDLYDFFVMKCDDEMRELIAHQRNLTGSPVQKWFVEMQAKLSDPFNIDWGKLTLLDDDEESHLDIVEHELLSLNAEIMGLIAAGDYEVALEKANTLRDRVFVLFGERPPFFTMVLHTLATIYHSIGGYEQADILAREAARLEHDVEGGDPTRYGMMLAMVAESHRLLGRFDDGLVTANEAVEVLKKHNAEDSVLYSITLATQAEANYDLGLYDVAQAIIERAIQIFSDHKNDDPEESGRLIASAKNILGLCLREQGRPMEGMGPLTDAMDWASFTLGQEHPQTAVYRANLAGLLIDIQDYSRAEKALINSAVYLRRTIGPCPQFIIVLNNLGALLLHQNRIDEADEIFQEAMWSIEELGGVPAHIKNLVSHNVAILLQMMGRFEEAAQQLEPIVERLYGRCRIVAGENLRRMRSGIPDGMPLAA